jgi:DNA-binding transcriptional LysR family regulator
MDLLAAFRAFRSIAEQGSLTRSASELGVAQSALSRQIAALERHVGGRVFHRTGRGTVPTELGTRLLPRAKALLDECDSLVGELRGEASSPVGTVDIGVVPAVRPIVAQVTTRLMHEFPRVRLRAHEGFSGQVEQWLASGRVDVGLFNRYGRGSVPNAHALLRSPMVVVGRKDADIVRKPQLRFSQLGGVPMAAPLRPNALIAFLESTAARQKVPLEFVFESASEAIIMDSVANAGLCTVVPLHVAARDYGPERFAWSHLTHPALNQVTWMAQTSAKPATPAARVVAALVREVTPGIASFAKKRG